MKSPAVFSLLLLTVVCACDETTIVGESYLKPGQDAGRNDGGPDSTGDDGANIGPTSFGGAGGTGSGGEVGSGGAGGRAAGGAAGGAGDGGEAPMFTQIVLQPQPETGEDAYLTTVGGAAVPVEHRAYDLAVETIVVEEAVVVRRALLRFRLPLPLPPAEALDSAYLSLRPDPDRVAHIAGSRWLIGRAVDDWDLATLTWRNQPRLSQDAFEGPTPFSSRDPMSSNVTELVRAALKNGQSPTFLLRLLDENQLNQRLLFCASEHTQISCRPTLSLSLRGDWRQPSASQP